MPTDATGTVGFYNQAQPGTDKGIVVATIKDGVATVTSPTRPLPVGTNRISAFYLGDSKYAANDSNRSLSR
jgi:hypothetical protein